MLVNEVKERAARRAGPLDTLVVAVGQAGGLDAVVEATARVLRSRGAAAVVVRESDEAPIAAAANTSAARCLVVVRLDPGAAVATGLFFSTDRSESPSGHRLAESLAEHAARAMGVPSATKGMSLTVLRETRMPATVLELGPLDLVVERTAQLADAVAMAVEGWATPLT
jgi:N-acetylmuramoyl-L-alanine amidase